ncbi:MAG: energy transducer TonB [Bacteroidetes bacterium]|nr:MAG: energy transducer TonB [Bacteroidota bacterium]
MKTKNIPHVTVNLKLIMVLPLIILILVAFSSCAVKKKVVTVKTDDETPFVVVEEMPIFPGGDSTLLAYLAQNTQYPDSAKANNIQGRVIVRFCVTKEGGVNRIAVLKGVSPELDAEAIRVVGSLPSFKPGKQGGKPVNVWYMVPIIFALK